MKVRMSQELESNAPRRAVKMFLHKVKKIQREWRIFERWQKKVCAQRIDEFIHAEQATIKAWYKKKEEVPHVLVLVGQNDGGCCCFCSSNRSESTQHNSPNNRLDARAV